MANSLAYYVQKVKDNPDNKSLNAAQIAAKAKALYEADPNSAFKKPVKTNLPNTTSGGGQLTKLKTGERNDWEAFTNGEIISTPASKNAAGVATQAYVTVAGAPLDAAGAPVAAALLASSKGFELVDLNSAMRQYLAGISPGSMRIYKDKLAAYYPSKKAYENSIRYPGEKDTDFQTAIKNAISEVSVLNYDEAVKFAQISPANRTSTNASLQSISNWIESRVGDEPKSSSSSSESSLTTQLDAFNEFNRTVQLYVGDPTLVDGLEELRNKYWEDLHKEELRRESNSWSVYDPITRKNIGGGTSYQQLDETTKLEMRLKLVTVGNKTLKVAGISLVNPDDLQMAGGLIGDTYTKLSEHAYEYGLQLSNSDMLKKVKESLLPGGTSTGSDTTDGLKQQKDTLVQLAKAKYKGLEKYIDSGLSVNDLSSDFRKTKDDELELATGKTDIFDSDVQDAIGGDSMASKYDYILNLRKNPDWRFTKKANEASAGFLDALLKTWGKVG